ncbi:MAG: HAMP domain-containing histidine kinase [Elusimicrobia bacterium]|nr:HAMP domain-containing histidine kinase [Elusimicrobiota bacterium]
MSWPATEPLARLRRSVALRLAAWLAVLLVAVGAGVLGGAYALLASSLRGRDRAAAAAELAELAEAYASRGTAGLRAEAAAQRILPKGSADIRYAAPDGARTVLAEPAAGAEDAPTESVSRRLADGSTLTVGVRGGEREDVLERFRGVAAAVLVPVALLALLGALVLTERALAPLRGLIETMRAIESGALGSRVAARGTGDELDELGVLFNRMLDKVASLVAALRGALDDAAHDLRTPLTRLRGGAELALRGGGAEEMREALADGVEECDEILAMLDGLMDVSEAQAGAMTLKLEDVDAGSLLADAVELYGPAAEEKGLRLEADAPAGLSLRADRARLRRAVANLVDNAVKYGTRGGAIRLSAAREGGEVVVRVRDDGPGIAPEDLPRVWDRLFRGDRSRSERGLGLGLSLVKAVAEAHGGGVAAESRPGEGALFVLRLPAA